MSYNIVFRTSSSHWRLKNVSQQHFTIRPRSEKQLPPSGIGLGKVKILSNVLSMRTRVPTGSGRVEKNIVSDKTSSGSPLNIQCIQFTFTCHVKVYIQNRISSGRVALVRTESGSFTILFNMFLHVFDDRLGTRTENRQRKCHVRSRCRPGPIGTYAFKIHWIVFL